MENNDELQHWGIKGMKWGVRRYQNKDGSLTPAGKKRYSNDASDYEKYRDEKEYDGFDNDSKWHSKSERIKKARFDLPKLQAKLEAHTKKLEELKKKEYGNREINDIDILYRDAKAKTNNRSDELVDRYFAVSNLKRQIYSVELLASQKTAGAKAVETLQGLGVLAVASAAVGTLAALGKIYTSR